MRFCPIFSPHLLVTVGAVLLMLSVQLQAFQIAQSTSRQQLKERMTIYIVLRSYDGKMWFTEDGEDTPIPADAPSYKDREAIMAYIANMKGPKPVMRTLKDGTQEPYVLDDGNFWVSVQSPSTGERHSYMVSSDGFHDVPANTYVKALEAVTGKNYVKKLEYQTVPISFPELKRIAAEVSKGKKVDVVIDEASNYIYRGSDFAIDFLLRIVDDETAQKLRESSSAWPMSIQISDNYYTKKFGTSAFARNGIPRGQTPRRSHLSQMSVHSLNVNPFIGPERMTIFFVLRSYDGTMWFTEDGKDVPIPEDAPSYKDREAIMAYIANMKGPKPVMRTLKDGTQEPYVLDDGNFWVSVQSPSTGERHAFLVSSDGFHDVPANTYVKAVEDVTGKNYVKKLEYRTIPMTFPQLKDIAAEVAGDKKVDMVIDEATNYIYRGSDFAIDFLLRIVDDETAQKLRESSSAWPVSMQVADDYYTKKFGTSAFARHGIPRGQTPRRSRLSAMSVHSLDVSPIYGYKK